MFFILRILWSESAADHLFLTLPERESHHILWDACVMNPRISFHPWLTAAVHLHERLLKHVLDRVVPVGTYGTKLRCPHRLPEVGAEILRPLANCPEIDAVFCRAILWVGLVG